MSSMTSVPRRLARKLRNTVSAGDSPTAGPAPVGIVEEFSTSLIKGWISVAPDSPPTRVSLHLGDLQITATFATEDRAMSGVDEQVWYSDKPPRRKKHSDAIRGPRKDRRNTRQQIRTFSFRIIDIWPYVGPRTPITIQVDGRPLPILGHGMFLRPPQRGNHGLPALQARLAEGHVLTQMGRIRLSKQLDIQWQDTVMGVYRRVREVLLAESGYDAFLIYGTLLGAVREGGYLSHDADFDTAFISRHRTGEEATAELRELALLLIREGFEVTAMRACLHINTRDHPQHRIDVFHLYFDQDGVLRFPFGIAGTSTITEREWSGLHEIDFPGGKAAVPVQGELVVEHLYGEDWRRPKPGFNWNLDRTDWAADGLIPRAVRREIYWANFYSSHEYTTGSPFSQFIEARADTPTTLIDIGCGDGRDACALGAAGRTALGLDQSAVGIQHAAEHASRLGVANRVSFRVCDVTDRVDLGQAIDEVIATAPGAVLFYLRFFLHAITEEVQDTLMSTIAAKARPGDVFAAEFRTDKDKENKKVHGGHYRRYQSAESFRTALVEEHGFTIVHDEERAGLSPYGNENPILMRVIATR